MIPPSKVTLQFAASVFALLFCASLALPGQDYKIEAVNLIHVDGNYQVTISSSGLPKYTSSFKGSPPRILLYFRDSQLAGVRKEVAFDIGPVKEIRAVQWKHSPAIVKLTILLAYSMPFDVKEQGQTGFLVNLDWNSTDRSEHFRAAMTNSAKSSGDLVLARTNPIDYSKTVHLNRNASDGRQDWLDSAEPVSLDLRQADLADVLRMLAKLSKLNIVASNEVTGKVTVSLSNVTIREALDNIVRANGYDYVWDGNVILVKQKDKFQFEDLETRIYRLKYIDARNLQAILKDVLSKQAKVHVFSQNFQQQNEETQGQGQDGTQGTSSRRLSRSSTLIVSDSRANLEQVSAMIAALDVPTPQIMIEAKLIEVSPQRTDKLGINWSKTLNAQVFREVIEPSGSPNRFSVEVPLDGGGVNYGTLSVSQFGAVLDFLNSSTNSKLISNPRILAMDNQVAEISVGTNVPIPQITRGVGGQGDVVTFDYRDVNISLRVTPHVGDNETITLFVNPVIEEITGEVRAGENSAPITSKREVQTVVTVKSNETVVIGGLIKERNIETLDKVWLIGDVPLIGSLFRHKDKTKQQTDLLIFITPRLLE
ncbi:MAG: secretin N-terminal domain-containing protein [bacterium]